MKKCLIYTQGVVESLYSYLKDEIKFSTTRLLKPKTVDKVLFLMTVLG